MIENEIAKCIAELKEENGDRNYPFAVLRASLTEAFNLSYSDPAIELITAAQRNLEARRII